MGEEPAVRWALVVIAWAGKSAECTIAWAGRPL